jgi:hypothetical protein
MFKALHPVKLAQYVTTRYTKFRSRSPHTDTVFLPRSNRTDNLDSDADSKEKKTFPEKRQTVVHTRHHRNTELTFQTQLVGVSVQVIRPEN